MHQVILGTYIRLAACNIVQSLTDRVEAGFSSLQSSQVNVSWFSTAQCETFHCTANVVLCFSGCYCNCSSYIMAQSTSGFVASCLAELLYSNSLCSTLRYSEPHTKVSFTGLFIHTGMNYSHNLCSFILY